MSETNEAKRYMPFALSAGVLALDQLSKWLVDKTVLIGSIAWRAMGDFFWLVHQRNTGAAFSLGHNLPGFGRVALLIILPLAIIGGLGVYLWKTRELSSFQRWAVAGIVGGGLGNLIDRVFRPEGVVDFLSFRFYGIFGLDRWPTFNVADATVVVCGILLALSTIFPSLFRRKGR